MQRCACTTCLRGCTKTRGVFWLACETGMSRVVRVNDHSYVDCGWALCGYAQEGNTSLMLAMKEGHEATAEALIAATASAGALDVQVDGRGMK